MPNPYIPPPVYDEEQIRNQCVGVDMDGLRGALANLERWQKEKGYSEARQFRILVYREVLTERLIGVPNAKP